MFYFNIFNKWYFVCFVVDRVFGRLEWVGSIGRVGVCEGGYLEVRVIEGIYY